MKPASEAHYARVAIWLHWIIAAALVLNLFMGWWMTRAVEQGSTSDGVFQAYQFHKSIGFAILALSIARLAWRLLHPIPPLPTAMPAWERFTARATHWAFYAVMLLVPLTGWLYVSAGWSAQSDRPFAVATAWFGLFSIPHLPFVEGASAGIRRAVALQSMQAHALMAYSAVLLIILHVAAGLKHHFVDRDWVLAAMVPWIRRTVGDHAPEYKRWPAVAGLLLVTGIGIFGWSQRILPASQQSMSAMDQPAASPVQEEAAIQPGRAPFWSIDKSRSRMEFSGTHAGNAFVGEFGDWQESIWFDPDDLPGSKVVVIVATGSARTGDATKDGSLAEKEWFDPQQFPRARFETSRFTKTGESSYLAEGKLRIKDRSISVDLPFTLENTPDATKMRGTLELDRTAFDLGMMSDPRGDWVSRKIKLEIVVTAVLKS
ncbi:YceI family protein [Sphingomonas bisphenolicum]